MKKRCQTVQLTVLLLLLVGNAEITAKEITDRSETELTQAKTLFKRNADDLNLIPDIGTQTGDGTEEEFAKQLYDIYGDDLNKRVLETVDELDFNNVDKYVPPYFLMKDFDDNEDSKFSTDDNGDLEQNEEKRGIDRYTLFGTLGKRLSTPMGDGSRLDKRRWLDYDYDKRIPLGFVGTLGKRAPMGFIGQLGKRAPMGFRGQLGKRAPMGFRGQLGKRAPMGFWGQLGKRAPMGFWGQLGKRAPMGFLGNLGKRAPMGFLGALGKRMPVFNGPQRRAPMGFIGQLGKRKGPMGFRGQLGKRET